MKLLKLFKNRRNKTSGKITRIAIDLDEKDINQLIKCLKTLRNHHFNRELTIKPSATDKGFHITAWTDKGVTLKKLLKIRKKAGDDRIRCMLDSKSHRMIQVLFSEKKKQKSDLVVDDIPMEYEVEGSEINVKVSYGET